MSSAKKQKVVHDVEVDLNKISKVLYIENISRIRDDLEDYCDIFNYDYNVTTSSDVDSYYHEFNIPGIGILRIYFDGTVKCIKFIKCDNQVPKISKNLEDKYELNQEDINNIHGDLLNLLKITNNENLLKLYEKKFYSNMSSTEVNKHNNRTVYRYEPGYCYEVNPNGFRILYTSRIIGGFSINENGEFVPPPHPQFDHEYNKLR